MALRPKFEGGVYLALDTKHSLAEVSNEKAEEVSERHHAVQLALGGQHDQSVCVVRHEFLEDTEKAV